MGDIRFQSLLLALGAHAILSIGAGGQQPQPPPLPDSVASKLPQADWVTLLTREPGLTEPVLIQPSYSLRDECVGQKLEGSVKFSFVVDASGNPRNVIFERALANGIDLFALKLMLESKFQPAMLRGSPVSAGREVEMHLRLCAEQRTDKSGKPEVFLRLRLPPEEKFEDWHHPPAQVNLAPISMPPGTQADSNNSSHLTAGKSLVRPPVPDGKGRPASFSISLIVDEHGIPQAVKPLKSTDQTLLPQIIQYISDIRFQPATNDGMPVPTQLTIDLDIKSDL
jgi:hypothetical protein